MRSAGKLYLVRFFLAFAVYPEWNRVSLPQHFDRGEYRPVRSSEPSDDVGC